MIPLRPVWLVLLVCRQAGHPANVIKRLVSLGQIRQHMLTFHVRQHMLTPMEPVLEIAEGAASTDPEAGLRAVAALRQLTERLEILQVDNARALGWSWQQIAERLGVTKQTVHRKHGRRTGRR
jgi:DNA-binding NarL/FixJ family response regulator